MIVPNLNQCITTRSSNKYLNYKSNTSEGRAVAVKAASCPRMNAMTNSFSKISSLAMSFYLQLKITMILILKDRMN
jgi:hypothetical protein